MNIAYVLPLLVVSVLFGTLFRRLGFVSVLGFIIGGVLSYYLYHLAGLNPEELSTDPTITLLSQLGLILLGFEIGSEFNIQTLRSVLRNVLILEFVSGIIIWNIWSIIGALIGLGIIEHILLFLITLNTSTGVLYKALGEVAGAPESLRRLILATTAAEDLIAVTGLTILMGITGGGLRITSLSEALLDAFIFFGKVLLLAFASIYIGSRVFKRASARIDIELFAVLSLAMVMIFSYLSIVLGLSIFFGAFLAGIAIGSSIDPRPLAVRLSVLRDLGLLIYFSLAGLFIPLYISGSVGYIIEIVALGILIPLLVMSIKYTAFTVSAWLLGYSPGDVARTGLYMISISEIGIIITREILPTGLIPQIFLWLSVMIFFVSSLISGIMIRKQESIGEKIRRIIPPRLSELKPPVEILREARALKLVGGVLVDFLIAVVAIIILTEILRGVSIIADSGIHIIYINILALTLALWTSGVLLIRYMSRRFSGREITDLRVSAYYRITEFMLDIGVLALLIIIQIRIMTLVSEISGLELLSVLYQVLLLVLALSYLLYIIRRNLIPLARSVREILLSYSPKT
ncbi:MAG: cation:proton antiporter [Sulfolobales archaeon]